MDSTGDYVQTFQILGLSDERATPMFDHQPLMKMPFIGGNIQQTHTHIISYYSKIGFYSHDIPKKIQLMFHIVSLQLYHEFSC